jgi:putative hydrolase of the HAD superfamily
MTVRALLFDLWGTLLYVDHPEGIGKRRRQANAGHVMQALREVGHPQPEAAVLTAFDADAGMMDALYEQGRDHSVLERLEQLLELVQPGLASDIKPDAMERVEEIVVWTVRENPPYAAPGAQAALSEAREHGLRIGLVSNTGMTPGYVLREILDELGLLEYLEAMTFSNEARLVKPTETVYTCTLEVLGVDAREGVFIGDSPGPDIAAPQQLGMTAVQIGDREQAGVTPDVRLETLDELFPALRTLGLVD